MSVEGIEQSVAEYCHKIDRLPAKFPPGRACQPLKIASASEDASASRSLGNCSTATGGAELQLLKQQSPDESRLMISSAESNNHHTDGRNSAHRQLGAAWRALPPRRCKHRLNLRAIEPAVFENFIGKARDLRPITFEKVFCPHLDLRPVPALCRVKDTIYAASVSV